MKILLIDNNKQYNINNDNDFNDNKEDILNSMNLITLDDKPPKEIINDIIKSLLSIQKDIKTNTIDTYIIDKRDKYEYCMFVYQKENTNEKVISINDNDKIEKNKIISRLIDNSYQQQYNEMNALNHTNKCVICKIDGEKLYDISKEEILETIKKSMISNAILITPDKIINKYYKNNPVYDLEGYDVYTTIQFMEGELMIFLNNPEVVIFENEVNFENKKLYKGIFDKWKIYKEKNKIPINVSLLISYHKENINISINEEIKQKIINYLSYKDERI